MNVAPNSVSGRVVNDPQLFAARMMVGWRGLEHDLSPLRPPDPVRLLDLDRLGPVDALERQQLVGVVGRLQVPLVELALLDQFTAPPAASFRADDLLAGQGAVVGAPVDRRLGTVRQALLQEAQEQPLVPHVIARVGGDDLVLPAERRAHRAELATHVLDVGHRPGERVAARLDRGVLGGQPERIEADREEHVEAMHPPEPCQRIAGGDDVPVTDVQVARWIGVHRQHVVLGPARVAQVRLVQAELRPARLPARLDGEGVVALDPGSAVGGLGHVVRVSHGRWIRFTPRRRRGVMVGGSSAGGATGTRTPDPLHAMQVLFQLSYSPTEGGL